MKYIQKDMQANMQKAVIRHAVSEVLSPEITLEDFAEVSSMFLLLGGIVNNVAGSALTEARAPLVNSKFFRHKVKYNANRAMREFDAYEYRMKEKLGKQWQFFMDSTDELQRLIHDDVERLYLAFRAELLKDGCGHPTLIARTEVAYTMLAFAEHFFNVYFDTAKAKTKCDVRHLFGAYRVKNTFALWKCVCEDLRRQAKVESDFQGSQQCRLALKVIENRIIDPDLVNKASALALRDNPDAAQYVDPKDMTLIKKYSE